MANADMNAVDWTFIAIFAAGIFVIVIRGAYQLGIIEGEYRMLVNHNREERGSRVSGGGH